MPISSGVLITVLIFSVIIGVGAYFFALFRSKALFAQERITFEKEKSDFANQILQKDNEIENWKLKHQLLEKALQENRNQQEELSKKMTFQFENLAQKIFEEKSAKFADQNLKNIFTILDPLKEKIKDFEKKVEDTYSSERSERGILRGEINKLMELNQLMTTETTNLTKALKGESKTQGNWGELILENILERSGLRKGEEYIIQGTDMDLRGTDGQILRPDVIVNLPDNKHLIVDSKMTLTAYEAYSSSENENDRDKFAALHIESLKKHIDSLSSKKYHLSEKLITPDFVILFMPLEPAFSLAFKLKPEIFHYAWEKNIAIVSPTTLLTTLRTVAALWKQERQQKNALEIAKRGGALYDKFAGLLKDLELVGEKLESAMKAHNDTISKISTGRGNLLRQVEDLKELGAKAEKSLPMIE